MAKIRKPSTYESKQTGRPGIFGINKPVGDTLKAAGGSPGYDPFTKSIANGVKLSMPHRPNNPPPKRAYVGHGGGSTGVGSKVGK